MQLFYCLSFQAHLSHVANYIEMLGIYSVRHLKVIQWVLKSTQV